MPTISLHLYWAQVGGHHCWPSRGLPHFHWRLNLQTSSRPLVSYTKSKWCDLIDCWYIGLSEQCGYNLLFWPPTWSQLLPIMNLWAEQGQATSCKKGTHSTGKADRQTEDLADVSLSVRKGSSTAKYDIFPVLFNILRFSNEVCDAGDGTEGVCYTGEECTEKVIFFVFLFVCERCFFNH